MGSALLPNVAEELLLNDGREVDEFFLAATTPLVLDQSPFRMAGLPVPSYGHLDDLGKACSRLAQQEQDDFVALKRGMLDHEVECLSHAFLHCIWFHDDVWLPDHATFLPEKCRRVSVMGFLMRLAADTRMVWGSCILDLAQELDEVGTHTLWGSIPDISLLEQETCPGEEQVEIGVWRSSWIEFLPASVPFAQVKDWQTCAVNNHEREPTARGSWHLFEAIQCHKTSALPSFGAHTMPFLRVIDRCMILHQ